MKRVLLPGAAFVTVLIFNATASHAVSVEVGISFDGASIHNAVPWHFAPDAIQFVPDSNGAVGPDHVVVMVNGRFAVHQKSDGALLQEKDLVVFWADAGADIGPVEDYSAWDPRILYDRGSQRWFAVSGGAPFKSLLDEITDHFVLAVSRTADPTQGWTGFEIESDPIDGSTGMDYPTLGINAEGVYVAGKMLPVAFPWDHLTIDVLVIPKSDLVAETPTIENMTMFVEVPWGDPQETRRNVQPVVDLDGGGQPETLLDFSAMSPNASPVVMNVNGPITAPTLGERITISMPKMSPPPLADQPGPKKDLYVGMGSLGSAVKRNGTLWAAQNLLGKTYGNVAIRWLQIDPETNKVLQSGVIEHPDLDLSYPSIAVNEFGEVVIGVSGSSETQFGSAYALAGQTLGGVTFFGAPKLLVSGVADFYLNARDWYPGATTRNNWNDYTTTVVDPSDPRKFWTFQEYVSAVDEWSVTAVGVSFVGCKDIPDGPTFESLPCRIYGLLERVNAETTLGTFQKKLAKKLIKAGKREEDARGQCVGSDVEQASKQLLKSAKQLAAHAKILASNAAIAALDATLRNELRAAGEAIRPDVELLSQQVACPANAGS